jgi:hypothetical protein
MAEREDARIREFEDRLTTYRERRKERRSGTPAR